MDFSSDGLVMGGHSVHLQEESGLEQDRGMPFVHCPEPNTDPFQCRPGDNRHAPRRCAHGNIQFP
jgi:hypothetical protein